MATKNDSPEATFDESTGSTDQSYWSIEYFQVNEEYSFITKDVSEDFGGIDTRYYVVSNEGNADGGQQINGIIEKRNARERKRVKAVNEAFAKLRQMIPSVANRNKRVSKVKTLQKALQYISQLRRTLENDENRIPARSQNNF
ncbi:protein atonal-like [Culicoides brevitarsis]|uniref:protein atonal-like n=1 Tax=Culicoides brevitarsis TaxID=469753 RepID=UPI00307BA72F